MKIYTAGYNAWSFYEFKTKIEELGNILIVDVRYSPKSFNPFWSKKNLKKHFGDKYIHLKNLGNVNYKNDEPIKIHDLERGCEELLEYIGKKDCLLLCACENIEACHRKVVVEKLQKMTLCQIIHLKEEKMEKKELKYFKLLEYIVKLSESTVRSKYECPNCSAVNLGHSTITDDPSYCEPDGLVCWSCQKEFFFDEICAEMCGFDIENCFSDNGEKE